ncbi:hypothetical protein TNCV_4356031 [Trichonephila clavipes]|nr:hypothetical protein TNCV_4356031 [Trichonephila clavipes]
MAISWGGGLPDFGNPIFKLCQISTKSTDIANPFILGLDFLKEHGFTLDFNKNELRSIHEEVTIFKIEHGTESIRTDNNFPNSDATRSLEDEKVRRPQMADPDIKTPCRVYGVFQPINPVVRTSRLIVLQLERSSVKGHLTDSLLHPQRR